MTLITSKKDKTPASYRLALILLSLSLLLLGMTACSSKLEDRYLQGQSKDTSQEAGSDVSQSPPPAPAPAPGPSPDPVEKEASPYLPDGLVLIEDTSDFTSASDNGTSIHRFFQAMNNGEPVFLYFYFDAWPYCKKFDVFYQEYIVDEQYSDIVFIKVNRDIESNKEFIQKFGTRYYPSFYTFDADGQLVKAQFGYVEEDVFQTMLENIKP